MKLFYSLILSLLFSIASIGQSIDTPEIIEHVIKLRSMILENSSELNKLQTTTEKWGETEFESDQFYAAVKTVSELKNHFNFDDEYILKRVFKKYESINIEKYISAPDVQVISNNIDLLYFVFEGILNSSFPYSLNPEPRIFKEIEHYNLKPHQRVAQIEGQKSIVPLFMCMVVDELNLMTSIPNGKFLFEMAEQLRTVGSIIDIDHAKTGNWELEEEAFDKIIIRNVYHHLKKKKAKLKTIHKALSPNGELILLEPDASFNKTNTVCPKSLEIKKIVDSVENSGFKLIDKWQKSEHYYLLKFRKIEGS